MDSERITIFTDGSSRGNPGPGGFGAIVVYGDKVKELGGREEHTTNNRMELTVVIKALEFLSSLNPLLSTINPSIFSDSKYVIHGITEWIFGWQKNSWKTAGKKDVENKDLWQKLFSLTDGKKIDWHYVEGHVGHTGNERCDEIATTFADNEPVKLFSGDIKDYGRDLSAKTNKEKPKNKTKSSAKAYLYMSMVNGKIKEYKTWQECEAEVKGVKGARFKKAFSEEEKEKLILEWKKLVSIE